MKKLLVWSFVFAACGGGEEFREFPDAGFAELPRTSPEPCSGQYTIGWQGAVVDERGVGIPNARPQGCVYDPSGKLTCLDPTMSDAKGLFAEAFPAENRCLSQINIRATHSSGNYGTTICRLDLNPLDAVFEVPGDIVMYNVDKATVQNASAAMPTVVFADGVEMDVDPEILFADELTKFASRRVKTDTCIPEANTMTALYAFEPETWIKPEVGFAFRVPNVENLPDGTKVDFFVLGGLDTQIIASEDGCTRGSCPGEQRCVEATGTCLSPVEEAEFAKFTTGTVVGNQIVPDANIPYISWMAYRPQ